MEEKRKISTLLIVMIVIIGICLVGFGIWCGINFFDLDSNILNEDDSSSNMNELNNDFNLSELKDNSANSAERYIVLSSKSSKLNYKKLNYGDIYIVYNGDFKKNWEKNLRESYKFLKDSEGKDLYIKGVFAKDDITSPIYFWGEDNYIYYFPNGYSKTNVTATKYSEKKVRNIYYDGESDITIEYVDGTKDNSINTELDYDNMVELNLNNPDLLYSITSNVDYSHKFNLIEYGLERVEVYENYNIRIVGDKQNKIERSEGYIKSALAFSDCASSIRLFYLTVDNKLYYINLISDTDEVFVSHLIDTNVEKIGILRNVPDSTCGVLDMIGYKKINSTIEYNANKTVISQ